MTVLDWAALHPWLAFFLSWPTMLVLVCWAWSFTTLISTLFTGVSGLFTQFVGVILVLVRGYPPVQPNSFMDLFGAPPDAAPDSARDDDDSSTHDRERNER